MEKIILHSSKPKSIGEFHFTNSEYMQYLYYPALLPDSKNLELEPRLQFLKEAITEAASDYYNTIGIGDNYPYIYLTVKQTFVPKGLDQNRPGNHSDGFGTDDVQYIWFDKWPTEFLIGEITVRNDDKYSMLDMDVFAHKNPNYFQPEPFHLYRIDQNNVHRTIQAPQDGVRLFVKITISHHKYAQKGNSRNYLMDYDWDFKDRELERNQPHQ